MASEGSPNTLNGGPSSPNTLKRASEGSPNTLNGGPSSPNKKQKTEPSIEGNRTYTKIRELKYGCNPHQKPAAIMSVNGNESPFEVLEGNPGYINLLDALNSWQLVKEVGASLSLPAAASFKHVSPAGCAVGVPLSDMLKQVYGVDRELTPLACAYVRAREADPKSSFGDWAALSEEVDECTAKLMSREVCDGVIAPGYSEAALAILKKKKKGAFIILKANPNFVPSPVEYREVYGLCFAQLRNDALITLKHMEKIVTKKTDISDDVKRDLVLATICLKYTQSNSVGYAIDGQMVGVGAGQQSRVDCVKLAGSKLETWWLRQHPKVLDMKFKSDVGRVAKLNARVQYIEGDFTPQSQAEFDKLFEELPEPLTLEEKKQWLKTLTGVSLASDAFFPFPDNIDIASMRGVRYISQPGGSVKDDEVIAACDTYGMAMCFTDTRLFHH